MLKCADIMHGTSCKEWNLPVDALVVWFMGNFPFHSARFVLKQLQFTWSISWRLHYNLCSDEICVSVSENHATYEISGQPGTGRTTWGEFDICGEGRSLWWKQAGPACSSSSSTSSLPVFLGRPLGRTHPLKWKAANVKPSHTQRLLYMSDVYLQ